MTTFKSQQRSAAINQSQFAFILSSYLTLLIPPRPPTPPHVECCVLCFNLMAEGGKKKLQVFQESWCSCLQTSSHCRHSARGSFNDGVVSCHRRVFILNTLTGWRSTKCKKTKKWTKFVRGTLYNVWLFVLHAKSQKYQLEVFERKLSCMTLCFSDTGGWALINMWLKTENRKPLKLTVMKISALPQDEWGFFP